MILGIIWWGMLLFRKNELYYNHLLKDTTTIQQADIISERDRQRLMIWGEGLVLGCSLLIGIYIINRSARREIKTAQNQNNFLLSVSHELKSPIAAIKLALQTISRTNLDPDKKEKFINSALSDTNRLEKMVQNVLLSTIVDQQPLELFKSDVQLDELLHLAVKPYLKTHQVTATDVLHIQDFIKIQADVQHLRQAIGNLIDNAFKYTDQPKSVIIDLERLNGNAVIRVESEGDPISREDKKNIFNKFHRGNSASVRAKEGTGIGLYLANLIVEAHGGKIKIISANRTNSFIIQLPDNG